MDDVAPRIQEAAKAIATLRPRVEAGEPWPLSEQFGTEPEAHWGPRETLAHIAEMLPFWLGEAERVLAAPTGGGPAPFGRVAADQLRVGVIERDRTLPLRELFGRIDAGSRRFTDRFRELGEADLAREGLHPRLGAMTVGALAERFVASHLEEHLEQLDAILAERG